VHHEVCSRFADALGQGDLVVNKPGIPKMARSRRG
jgi:hypothetical protein